MQNPPKAHYTWLSANSEPANCRSRGATITVALAIALSLLTSFGPGVAHATTACWENASLDYDTNFQDDFCPSGGTTTCATCHDFTSPTTIGVDGRTGSQRLPAGSGPVSVTPTGTNGRSYSWRYRTSGTSDAGPWLTDSGGQIDVPAAGRVIQYCLGVNDGVRSRLVRCGVAEFERAAPDLPPVITGRSPRGTIALQVGAGAVPVQLQVSDENPSSLVYSAENVGPALSVTPEAGGRFSFAPLAEGSGTVRLVVRDANPANASASLDVPYTVTAEEVPNRAPRITAANPSAPLALQIGGPARTVTLTVDDDDALGTLTFAFSGGPAGLGVNPLGDGRFELAPGASAGSGDVAFTVTDPDGESGSLAYGVTIAEAGVSYVAPSLDATDPAGGRGDHLLRPGRGVLAAHERLHLLRCRGQHQ